MFLHLSVILSTGAGVPAPVHAEIHTHSPLGRHPPNSACWDTHTLPPGQTPPRTVHAGIHMPTAADGNILLECILVEYLNVNILKCLNVNILNNDYHLSIWVGNVFSHVCVSVCSG